MCPVLAIIDHMRTEIRIAEFKSKLSRYLRSVQAGNEILIKDRNTPVARLVPPDSPRRHLQAVSPSRSLEEIDRLPFIKPKSLKKGDLDRALRWVRRERLEGRDR